MKYSVILGNLGNTCDRYLSSGYKESRSVSELFNEAAAIKDVKGMELVGSWDITSDNVNQIRGLLDQHHLKLVSIIPDHFSHRRWGSGAFTSRDSSIRRQAVEHTKEMIDILIELKGELINLWPGQDGYDYPLQGNFDDASAMFVEGIRECAQYRPEVKISLEYKPKEPRNFLYLARAADTLLTALETGCANVGVTIDVGHSFVAGENVSEAAFRLMKAGRLFHMHFNDNHSFWDDDMMVGSVHTIAYIELIYWLKKTGYNGWWSMDQYPYREDGREALNESIRWIEGLAARMEHYGMDKIGSLIAEGKATRTSAAMRELLLGSI